MLDAGASPDAARIDANYGWACDPVADTGCPAGRRCGLLSGAPTCVASGSVALAGTCASEAECARGLTCQNRRCHALCYAGDRLACGPDVVCDALMLSFSDLPAAGLAYCTETCDPLAASNPACGPMTHCSLEVATASRGYTFCVGLGTHLEGDLCGGQSDCADGLACAYDGGRCRAFCDPSAPSACPIGRTCQPALMLSARTIGVCLP